MLVILGYVVVLLSVFGGFALAGGHLAALIQPVEFLMIGGAAVGAFLVGNNLAALMTLLFEILTKVRKEGLMSIEGEIEKPEESPIFSKYPSVMNDPHTLEFITDYLRLMVSGNMDAFQIENLMDNEIETHHSEGEVPVHCIARIGDAMPAFGIVAAVMGVVHTMESVGLPPAELGALIAHALVGTFLGILLSYGFVGPLSTLLEQKLNESSKMLQCVKVTLVASLNGYAPVLAVEFGRKVLFSTERPSFIELESHIRKSRSR